MPNVARVGDAISHGGAIVQGAQSVFCNGIPVARRTDPVICNIHGAQTITGGSSTVICEGLSVARVGDSVSCGASIVEGSPDVFAGG